MPADYVHAAWAFWPAADRQATGEPWTGHPEFLSLRTPSVVGYDAPLRG